MDNDFSLEYLDGVLKKILWGKSFVNIYSEDKEYQFILRSLTIKESNLSKYIYDRELYSSINEGVLTNDQLREYYDAMGVWTSGDDELLESKNIKLNKLKNQKLGCQFFSSKKKLLEKNIKQLKHEIKEMDDIKSKIFSMSAENRAEEMSRRYIVMMTTEKIDESPYWEDMSDFQNEDRVELIYRIALEYFRNNIFSVELLRAIARHPMWRFKWNVCKNGADIFGKSASEWSEMQDSLVYWSQYYDYVFDNPNRPPDNIIADDDACDSWVRDQSKSGSKVSFGGNTNKNIFGTKQASKKKEHTEQFIMVQPGDMDSVKKVQDMNTSTVRNQLKQEHDAIKSSDGRVSEWKLRGRRWLNEHGAK